MGIILKYSLGFIIIDKFKTHLTDFVFSYRYYLYNDL